MRDQEACEYRVVEWSEEKLGYFLRDVYGVTEPIVPPVPPSTGPPNAGHVRSAINVYFD